MAGFVLKNAQVLITDNTGTSTVDFSNSVRTVRLSRTFDLLDDTHMGQTAHSRITGLENWQAEIHLLQTFASTALIPVDKMLSAYISAALPVTVAVRPVLAARTSDNPEYSGLAVLETFNPVDGDVGGLQIVNAMFRSAGSLSRFTSSSS